MRETQTAKKLKTDVTLSEENRHCVDLMDVNETEEFFNYKWSKWTIYELVRRRALPCIKIGKRVYFRRESLIKWLEAQEQASMTKLKPTELGIRRLK